MVLKPSLFAPRDDSPCVVLASPLRREKRQNSPGAVRDRRGLCRMGRQYPVIVAVDVDRHQVNSVGTEASISV